jgi:hypothetical protein
MLVIYLVCFVPFGKFCRRNYLLELIQLTLTVTEIRFFMCTTATQYSVFGQHVQGRRFC